MILIRLLIPITVAILLVWLAVRNVKNWSNEATDSDKKDVDKYVELLKSRIKYAEEQASSGVKVAEADLKFYKQQLEKYNTIKQQQLNKL